MLALAARALPFSLALLLEARLLVVALGAVREEEAREALGREEVVLLVVCAQGWHVGR